MLGEIQGREEEIAASEAKFRSIVETTSDWIWEVDSQGRYVYSSPKITELLGYELEEIIGKTPFDFMVPEDTVRVKKISTEISENREAINGLVNTAIHKDGHRVVLDTSGVPVFDENGGFCGYRGIDRDIRQHIAEI